MNYLNHLKNLAVSVVLVSSSSVFAGFDTETDENGVILAGHDVIGYFEEGKPVLGSAEYTAIYNDAIYRFKSARNRDLFVKSPAKYAPQYGGFCAYGMTFGKKFEIDGKAFEVVDAKLYVNKNLSVYNTWSKAIPRNIDEANEAWPTVVDTDPDQL